MPKYFQLTDSSLLNFYFGSLEFKRSFAYYKQYYYKQ